MAFQLVNQPSKKNKNQARLAPCTNKYLRNYVSHHLGQMSTGASLDDRCLVQPVVRVTEPLRCPGRRVQPDAVEEADHGALGDGTSGEQTWSHKNIIFSPLRRIAGPHSLTGKVVDPFNKSQGSPQEKRG